MDDVGAIVVSGGIVVIGVEGVVGVVSSNSVIGAIGKLKTAIGGIGCEHVFNQCGHLVEPNSFLGHTGS